MFNASKPGIFKITINGHESMVSYLVVLPDDWSTYNPRQESWNFTTLVIPDMAGDGYDKFFPSTFVVNMGDNVTFNVRNMDDMPHGFAIASFGINVAINPATDMPNGTINPVTTKVPTFTANIPGVYTFICTVYCGPGHIEMVGTLVVLPKAGIQYEPVQGTRYGYLFIIPDFAGNGYDKFIPSNIVVNQGDLVYIKIRNTDEMKHGFMLAAFNINNETVKPAVEVNGTLQPTDTYITPFVADKPGVYVFFCSIYCGEGHNEMIGYLIVLPRVVVQQPPTSSQGVALPFLLSGITGTLLVGIAIGMLLVRWSKAD
jgi:heme/copper-type cytochrome/quinol oxidase subunit 2